jgi:hypothetical protein
MKSIASGAIGLLFLAGSVVAADRWLATDSGCKVWSDEPLAEGETVAWSGGCKDDKLDGTGQLTVTREGRPVVRFDGEMRGGKANGKGRMEVVTDNGPERYEGSFKDSLLDGYGVLILANGDRYEGGFRQDKPDGFGLYQGADGLFQGDIRKGKPHGEGYEKLPGGEQYRGWFYQGQRHGIGTLLLTSGETYEGGFVDGVAHGQGRFTTAQGDVYEGTWRRGEANGEFSVTLADGSKERQLWQADQRVD